MTGCAEWWEIEEIQYPLSYYLEASAPEDMKIGVREAAKTWNELAIREGVGEVLIDSGEAESRIRSDSRFDIISLSPEEFNKDVGDGVVYLGKCRKVLGRHSARVDVLFAPHANVLRWAESNEAIIDAYYRIALHELGHVLGLGHTLDETELMYYYGRPIDNFPAHITIDAEDKFCQKHGCQNVKK
jgi:hypothetical protein